MSANIIAETYSNALFDLAKEMNALERFETDLLYAKSILEDHKELGQFLTSPIVAEKGKLDVLGKIFGTSIHTKALHFMYVMIKRRRARYILDTIEAYIAKAREARGIVEAKVIVTEPLSESMKAAVKSKLHAISGKDYLLDEQIDPSIVGGMIIQIGDRRIDFSMARQLDEMKKSLLTLGSVEREVKD